MERKTISVQYTDFLSYVFKRTIEPMLKERYNIVYSDSPDFLFYSVYGTGREYYKYKNCVKIFCASEGVIPDFNECDYAIGSYPMQVGERYLQIPYHAPDRLISQRDICLEEVTARHFCNFIYTNDNNGKGAALRKAFCKELMKYKHVDCPGYVLNNMRNAIEPRNGKWHDGKMIFIHNYKFTIAFENAQMPGMASEKILDPLIANSVPIYWGGIRMLQICIIREPLLIVMIVNPSMRW